ncbi:MAG: redox-regulated ATPase YchF [Deltaproteobacteria bacterium]|nr:redox-regulated ATPase YchF [Deltaproteobacteria bacterium]
MQAGIIGMPGSGKTTVFRALTGFAAGAPSGPRGRLVKGVVKVQDARLDDLGARYRPKKLTHAEVVFSDLPGPGQGDGGPVRSIQTSFVADMRNMDLLVHVLREFDHPVTGPADPLGHLVTLREEMILWDLEVVEKRLARIKKGEHQNFPTERAMLGTIHEALSDARTIRSLELADDAAANISGFAFLTQKPHVVVLNRDDAAAGDPVPEDISSHPSNQARAIIPLCARLETELGEIDPQERGPFMQEMGIESAGTDVFVREVYRALGLVSFFTTGGDEVRAWTVRAGTVAQKAAGKIHTDMERGFIRAEVFGYDEFVSAGDEAALKRAGRIRQEGKDYIIRDGDILNIKFNV